MKPGEIRDFYYLHLDTATPVQGRPLVSGQTVFQVLGKRRPMVVVHTLRGSDQRKDKYFLLKLTTKSNGRRNINLGTVVDNRCSYCNASQPEILPHNLLCDDKVRAELTRDWMDNLIRIARHSLEGGQSLH